MSPGPDGNPIRVLLVHDDASVFAALRAGARGYVMKGTDGHGT